MTITAKPMPELGVAWVDTDGTAYPVVGLYWNEGDDASRALVQRLWVNQSPARMAASAVLDHSAAYLPSLRLARRGENGAQ